MKRIFPRGFTLIELMIVIVITAVLVGGGLASYGKFNQRQRVKLSGLNVYNNLRLAQSSASSNSKPVACGAQTTLSGYKLIFTSSSEYEIRALCPTEVAPDNYVVIKSNNLDSGVILFNGSGEVTFNILGGGSVSGDFCLEGYSNYYLIEVSDSGEIIDGGFVGSC